MKASGIVVMFLKPVLTFFYDVFGQPPHPNNFLVTIKVTLMSGPEVFIQQSYCHFSRGFNVLAYPCNVKHKVKYVKRKNTGTFQENLQPQELHDVWEIDLRDGSHNSACIYRFEYICINVLLILQDNHKWVNESCIFIGLRVDTSIQSINPISI